jgi:predicted ABC-type ATPase
MSEEERPFLLVIAGPNGSGKTTLITQIIASGKDVGHYINADDIAAQLSGSYAERVAAAQSQADAEREICLAGRQSFSFETVMSHPSKLEFMRRARSLGYHVTLFFVAIADPRINVARVASRVKRGGHDVDEERIIARWYRTLNALADAVAAADRSVIFDNTDIVAVNGVTTETGIRFSSMSSLRPVVQVSCIADQMTVECGRKMPDWVLRYLVDPLRRTHAQGRLDVSFRYDAFG